MNAQTGVYQLPNSNFEQWEAGVKLDGTTSTVQEPVGWSSYATGTGGLIPTALILGLSNHPTQENRGTADNPNYYVRLYSANLAGMVNLNGFLTTGVIQIEDMQPITSLNNDAFTFATSTDPGANNFRQPFTGRPDALKALVKYTPVSQGASDIGAVSAWIHTAADFQSRAAETPADIAEKAVANATLVLSPTETRDEWKELIAPFDYVARENEPAYILISALTNAAFGGGSAGDELLLDDVEMVYYSTLTDIKVGGESIEGFDEDTKVYNFEGSAPALSDIEAVAKSPWATVEEATSETEGDVTTITIVVKGNDFDVSGNSETYQLVYTSSDSSNEKVVKDGPSVYTSGGQVYVTGFEGKATVYTTNGQAVTEKTIAGSGNFSLPAGIYIVRTNKKSTIIVVK
ncbi:MAG: PCMD domain-containing protein [Tannerellaceae bacterium]|nr:PCMD domain-containing protein [Tannerellaceae bacterium]